MERVIDVLFSYSRSQIIIQEPFVCNYYSDEATNNFSFAKKKKTNSVNFIKLIR